VRVGKPGTDANPGTAGPGTTDDEHGRSLERYRLISDSSTDAVYETDRSGIIQWISPSVHGLLGWEPERLYGTDARALFHPMDADRMMAIHDAVCHDGRPHDDVPCMMSTATGGFRAVTLRARPLLDPALGVLGVFTTIGDTHDRDSALRALATLSQGNRALVRATDETILLQQMCETIVETGRYPLSWYGRPVDDAEQSVAPIARAGEHGGYLDEIHVSWGDDEFGRGPTGRCLRTGQTQVENDFTPDPEYRPWLNAATRRGFKSSISLPVLVNGAVDGALMVYADEAGTFDALAQDLLEDLAADLGYGIERLRGIRDLERSTREEQEQRQRLQATLDTMIDPFVVLEGVRDEAGTLIDLRYSMANETAVAYNQLPREQVIGARLLDVSPGQLEHGPLQLYFDTIETGVPTILDDYAYDFEPLGEERRFDIRAVKSGDGLALTWRDVTDRHLAAQQLADSERRYRLLAENSSDVILLADPHMTMSWVSASALQTLGWEPGELTGHSAAEYIHPDDLAGLTEAVAHSTETGEVVRPRYRWRRPDGSYRWMEAAGQPIDDDGSGRPGRVVALRDIEAIVGAERDLEAREERYRLLAENASDVVFQVDADGTLAWTSPSVTRVLGWSPDDIVGRVAMTLMLPEDRERALAIQPEIFAGRAVQGEFRMLRADGASLWMFLSVRPVATPDGVSRIISMRDIDVEVAARNRLEFALGHDQITGMATRQVMITRINYIRSTTTGRNVVAVLCIGIDSLSQVNEALTHAAGDVVLTTVAARVAGSAGNPDLVGRGSGDEFLVIVPELANGADAAATAEAIRVAAQGPILVGDQQVNPTVSIGIAIGGRGIDGEQLLRDSSLALRKAKNNGRDRCEFVDPGLATEAQNRLSLEAEIREGLRDGEFASWFQPIVSMDTGRVAGYESLVRWVRPGEVVMPGAFLQVAERTALINELDEVVLRQSLASLATLPEPLFVGVNVTAATLARTPYADVVLAALEESGADPHRLHLEVTETMLLNLTDGVPDAMERLARLGVRWYVDDFGTGYSSISHLRDLPVAGLKLDQSFTSGIGKGDATSRQLAQALIGLANGLGLDTVAEGIETPGEADYLRSLGWRHGQGWLFGKAQPLT
jgi:diguanylate cyclase (GGDEF)-like protein/PAS domain S-box-containing protein